MTTQQLILEFADAHWFLTWCILWFLWVPVLAAYVLPVLTIRLIGRVCRLVVVLLRGWPPAHLDADGDWKPAPQEPKKQDPASKRMDDMLTKAWPGQVKN